MKNNKFNRVLFVQAKYDSVFSNVLPAGIGCLSEYLGLNEIKNDIFDLNVPTNTEQNLHEKVASFKPDLIGLSIMSLNYKHNYGVMNRLKKAFPGLKIVAGGAHVSTMRNEVLEECDGIDYGIVLEGEYTLMDLISGENKESEIKGLIYREEGKVSFAGERTFIKDLDSLPFPAYQKFKKNEYSTLISIFTSRGCPYECTYCPVKLAIGRRFIVRSPKNVVDELEYHYNQGYREFSFRDDCLTLIQERVYDICDEIEKRKFKNLHLMCDNGIRADRVDYNLLKRMKEVGFKMIGLGVEAGDDRILKNLKKSSTVKDMENAISSACKLGYIVELYFLIGSPGETWEEFEKSVRLACKYPVMIASFYHLLPYPNTELFELAEKNNYLLKRPEEYLNDGSQRINTPFLSTPEFPFELRKKAFDYAYETTSKHINKTRKVYYKKNAYEKFKGAGLNHFLASLFSSIYAIDFIHDHIFNNALFSSLKKNIRKQMILKRRST